MTEQEKSPSTYKGFVAGVFSGVSKLGGTFYMFLLVHGVPHQLLLGFQHRCYRYTVYDLC